MKNWILWWRNHHKSKLLHLLQQNSLVFLEVQTAVTCLPRARLGSPCSSVWVFFFQLWPLALEIFKVWNSIASRSKKTDFSRNIEQLVSIIVRYLHSFTLCFWTYRLVDVEQRDGGRVVLNKSHLRRHRHHTRHGEVQQPSTRLLQNTTTKHAKHKGKAWAWPTQPQTKQVLPVRDDTGNWPTWSKPYTSMLV